MNKNIIRGLVSAGVLAAAGAANAAIDTAAATTGITEAQTAVLLVIGAMMTMAIAIWGVKKLLRMFGGN